MYGGQVDFRLHHHAPIDLLDVVQLLNNRPHPFGAGAGLQARKQLRLIDQPLQLGGQVLN
jgi:hypothetical protein